MVRERDTRQIIRGVQMPVAAPGKGAKVGGGFTLRTYHGEDDLDELESRLTPEQCARLKAQGAISGDWRPGETSEAARAKADDVKRLKVKLAEHEQGQRAQGQAGPEQGQAESQPDQPQTQGTPEPLPPPQEGAQAEAEESRGKKRRNW